MDICQVTGDEMLLGLDGL